jgi:hypothetical protein
MTLHRRVAAETRSASKARLFSSARIGLLALSFTACLTPPTRVPSDAADNGGDGGTTGKGGSGGSGGDETGGQGGSGGTGKLDAGPVRVDSGAGGGGPPDAAAKLDASKDTDNGADASSASWEKMNLVLANCIFCHNDPSKRVDLQESGLYMRIINMPAAHAPANCTNKILVVPGQPMMSLLYLKIAGKMPANCGAQMPFKKPPVTAMELKIMYDWIAGGAPAK